MREYSREFAAQLTTAGLEPIMEGKLRHSNISRMRAAGIAADVVAAWHGHTERMTQAVHGRVTDDHLTAAANVFSPELGHKASFGSIQLTSQTRSVAWSERVFNVEPRGFEPLPPTLPV